MLLQAFDAEHLAHDRGEVPGKRWRRMLEDAAKDHGPARKNRQSHRVTLSTPEEASTALWQGGTGQQSMSTHVGAIVHPEFGGRFALRQRRGVM
jgi:hypothetical protein